jgi:hypothetical protein
MNDWQKTANKSFDVRIFVCGYESRSRFVFEKLDGVSQGNLILDYQCSGTLNYDENMRRFQEFGNCKFVPVDGKLDAAIQTYIGDYIRNADRYDDLNILFDISSCSRSVMATVFLAISSISGVKFNVSCTYALSTFGSPPTSELPSHISQPVIGDLSGWSDDLTNPPCAVIGLGFEPGRALGCIDYLEIPEVRLFMPIGPDARFREAVSQANAALVSEADGTALLYYDVLDANGSYEKLESLVFGLMSDHRPVLIPLGPKIFAALCIVLAIKMLPAVCVWRTSSGSIGGIRDQKASGEISVFNTVFKNPLLK